MAEIKINAEICKKDGLCAMACGRAVFRQDEKHTTTDYILREPPVLVLFCADSAGGSFTGINASQALHNAALAAETVGLGCYFAGFVVIASDRDDSITRFLSLPATHKIYGALATGYPRLKFKKWPERNPAKVTWL